MTPAERMSKVRVRMIMNAPWFGHLAMMLKMEECADSSRVPTMATDGTNLLYNPAFIATLPDSELTGVVAHEVMHCALLHPYRRGARDNKLWNVACDHAINPLLIDAGFTLPAGALTDPAYKGLSADVIYAKLQNAQNPPDSGGKQRPSDDGAPCPTGEFTDGVQPGSATEPGKPGKLSADDW